MREQHLWFRMLWPIQKSKLPRVVDTGLCLTGRWRRGFLGRGRITEGEQPEHRPMLSDATGRVYETMSKDFISESSPVSGQRQGAPERGPRTRQGQADTSASCCIYEITTGTESSGLETWSFTMDCLRSTMDIKRGCDLGLKVTNEPWWKLVHQIWSCDKDLKDDVAP